MVYNIIIFKTLKNITFNKTKIFLSINDVYITDKLFYHYHKQANSYLIVTLKYLQN